MILCRFGLHSLSEPYPRTEIAMGKQRVVIQRACLRLHCGKRKIVVARPWIGLGSAAVRGEIRRMRAEVRGARH